MKRNRILTISIEVSSRDINKKVLTSLNKTKKVNKPSPKVEELQHIEEFNARIFFHKGEEYIRIIGEFKFNN